jgi:ACS family pantothenate transporter-like MFS transporter
MKEDLNFHGNQLNQINTVFTVGYIIGQVPSNLALYYIKPRIFFPSMMLVWGALTMVSASAKRPGSIMAIRFFQGIAESSTFVGTHYILGAWYTKRELGKRSGIFTSSGLAGTMISGFIQTGIHSSLDGKAGLVGWRWLFLIDGIITLPVAIYGFVFFPDTPHKTVAPYLSASERVLAQSRVPDVPARKPLTFSFLKRVLTSWHWYLFTVLWIIAGETESFSSNALLALYMKSSPTKKYTVAQLNNYPTAVPAVGIISTLFWATLTDFLSGKRYLVAYFIGITGIATSAMILASHKTSVVFAAYYWAGTVYACQATFFAWANDAMRMEDDQLRAVVIASMNMGSNAVNAWWSILFYGANFAPWFTVSNYPPSIFVWSLSNYPAERDVGHDCYVSCIGDLGHCGIIRVDMEGGANIPAVQKIYSSQPQRTEWTIYIDRRRQIMNNYTPSRLLLEKRSNAQQSGT